MPNLVCGAMTPLIWQNDTFVMYGVRETTLAEVTMAGAPGTLVKFRPAREAQERTGGIEAGATSGATAWAGAGAAAWAEAGATAASIRAAARHARTPRGRCW